MLRPRTRVPAPLLLGTLALATVLLAVLAAGLGFVSASAGDVLRIVLDKIGGGGASLSEMDPVLPHVVWSVRLPRIFTSMAVGAGLAVSGVLFQGILLNPLADPYTLGVSAGAAFGAALSIVLGFGFAGALTVPAMAFLGALVSMATVLMLGVTARRLQPTNLILAGVIVAAILSAGISFLKFVADEQVNLIVFWLMGSFVGKSWLEACCAALAALVGLGVALICGRDLNALSLGSRSAASLGVDTTRLRCIVLVAASLVTASCVAVSGIIGFVGLIVPHLLRLVSGPDSRLLAAGSALAGGLLLLAADTVTRVLLPNEAPVGLLTALLGGPFFCYLFKMRQADARRS